MADVPVEHRNEPRHPMVLAVEVVELLRGARLNARTADLSRTGCYIDTLNPNPAGSNVRVRISHHTEHFEAIGTVAYTSPGLGMGVTFTKVTPEAQAMLERWLDEARRES